MSEKNRLLTFLLQNGIASRTWDPAERLLTLVFRQDRILKIFCGLCYLVDTENPDGTTNQGKDPGLIKNLITGKIDHPNLTLKLRFAGGVLPSTLAVFLPEFLQDVTSGKTEAKLTVCRASSFLSRRKRPGFARASPRRSFFILEFSGVKPLPPCVYLLFFLL